MLEEKTTCRVRLTFRCPICRDRLVLEERDNFVMVQCERCKIRLDLSYEDIRLFLLEKGYDTTDAVAFEILYEKYVEVVRCVKAHRRRHERKNSAAESS